MAVWRDSAIEMLIGGPIDATGLTFEAVQGLIEQKIFESEVLDFKRAIWAQSKGNYAEREFAKDVSAMANRRGGVLLVGVRDVEGQASELCPLQIGTSREQEQMRLSQALVNFQAPLAACEFIWIDGPANETLLAVVVPRSPRAPHAVLGENDELRYPMRHGMGTTWLNEHDVADHYRARFLGQMEGTERTQDLLDGLETALRTAEGLWLFAVVSPERPLRERLDSRSMSDIAAWYHENRAAGPLTGALAVAPRPYAAPGMARFTIPDGSFDGGDSQVRGAYLELHVSGAAVAANRLDFRDEEHAHAVGTIQLVDDLIKMIEPTVQWSLRQAGASSTAEIIVGITSAGSPKLGLANAIELWGVSFGTFRRVEESRTVVGPVSARFTADLGASTTTRDRMPLVGVGAAALLQFFGKAESNLISQDGVLRTAGFMTNSTRVAEWAERQDCLFE